ncbi:MAG: Uma2 family endonuclease [Deltaproteobacteria bacterium]|nr:Uma2 family endonuclease [Deltaproteobacteria bacterium]
MPESQPHDQTIDLLKAILLAWVARTGRSAQVARNLAVRWEEREPNVGVDPDLCVIEPRTPEGDELESLCTWKRGHVAPRLAIEVVSSKPRKDYATAPEKCAAAGVEELWVFDPKLVGPRSGGGPNRIQIWRREDDGFRRIYAGEGPAWSPLLSAWAVAVHEGQRLRVADDREGTQWWLTAEERERAAKEAERAAREAERAAKEAALARVAELEAQLGKG